MAGKQNLNPHSVKLEIFLQVEKYSFFQTNLFEQEHFYLH